MKKKLQDKYRTLTDKVKNAAIANIVSGTAINAELTPVYAAFETMIAEMSDEVSIRSRLIGAAMGYTIVGPIYRRMRDVWREKFEITDRTRERTQQIHDGLCAAVFGLAISPPIYLVAGSRDFREIATGTLCSAGFSLVNGIPLGYAMDLFNDLTGLKSSERVPNLIKRQSSTVKKGLAAALVGTAIGLTLAIYHFTPDKAPEISQTEKQQINSQDY